jgi:hypothetical protein
VATELWAIHVHGPDSIIAMASKEDAEREAAEVNVAYETFKNRPDASPLDARWHAEVVPWPWSAEEHAETLSENDGDYF